MGVLKVNGPPSALNSFKVFFFLISLTGTLVLVLLLLVLLSWDDVPLSPLAPESPVTDKVADRCVRVLLSLPGVFQSDGTTLGRTPTKADTAGGRVVVVLTVVTNASVVPVVAAPQTRHVTNGTNLIW